MSISDYSSLSDERLADLLDDIAKCEVFEHRGVLLLEAARRLRENQPVSNNG